MDCKFESAQQKLGKEKKWRSERGIKRKIFNKNKFTWLQTKLKVGDFHFENLIGLLTIISTIQKPFWKMSACVELAERRTEEHQGEHVG